MNGIQRGKAYERSHFVFHDVMVYVSCLVLKGHSWELICMKLVKTKVRGASFLKLLN